MIYKSREKSAELKIMEMLHTRMDLSPEDKKNYLNLAKGLEGEMHFDSFTEKLQCECLVLNDLLLASNNTTFQIDALIIVSDTIYLYEIKNFEGDYYYKDGDFYSIRHFKVLNPLHQLNRKESLLLPLLRKHGYHLPLDGKVVFINENFTLYQSPMNQPIIYPTQIRKYFSNLNNIHSKLHKRHKLLAEKLVSLHITNPSVKPNIPPYDYTQLRKGISCGHCKSLSVLVDGRKCFCPKCKHEETVASGVVRSAREFQTLFPEKKMTTKIIHDWCQVVDSKKRVKYILDKHFKAVGKKRWLYYK